jgi:hypothetical protein
LAKEYILKEYAKISSNIFDDMRNNCCDIIKLLPTESSDVTNIEPTLATLLTEFGKVIESIQILYSHCRVPTALILLRTAFEIYVQMFFLMYIDSDTEKKADAYIVFNAWRSKAFLEKLNKLYDKYNISDSKKINDKYARAKEEYEKLTKNEYIKWKGNISELLNDKKYINNYIDVYKGKKKNLKNIVKDIDAGNADNNVSELYDICYNFLSTYTHGNHSMHNLLLDENGICKIKSLDDCKNGLFGIRVANKLLWDIMKLVIKLYENHNDKNYEEVKMGIRERINHIKKYEEILKSLEESL